MAARTRRSMPGSPRRSARWSRASSPSGSRRRPRSISARPGSGFVSLRSRSGASSSAHPNSVRGRASRRQTSGACRREVTHTVSSNKSEQEGENMQRCPHSGEVIDIEPDFDERVRANQRRLTAELQPYYDFIVCGSGSSGSVVARRLAEHPDVRVLLVEAGGSDDVPSVRYANQWFTNLGTERDWPFHAQPNPHLNGRVVPLGMGKVLGGGSSINVMAWARGHRNDWNYFASEAGDATWGYDSVLNLYRGVEDWHGAPDPTYRGTGGPVFVQPAPDPNPIAPAMLEGTGSVGILTFENQNGRMMEGSGGSAILDVQIRDGKRQSVFRAYTFPWMDRPNLTVLTHALVTRITFEGKRATGVECIYNGKTH